MASMMTASVLLSSPAPFWKPCSIPTLSRISSTATTGRQPLPRVYLNLYYRHLDKFNHIKTVFTIHNIAYQGKYGMDILEDTCGIGARDAHIVEYDGCANFMKGAIETADKVTTVSPTYAQEILDPWFSHGLDGLLRQKQYKLCGILNGIDVDVFNPATTRISRRTMMPTRCSRASPSAKQLCRMSSA